MGTKVEVRRAWPTWTVDVDGREVFTGLWRFRTAERLAARRVGELLDEVDVDVTVAR